jgi:hypothetical protein
MFPPVDPTQRRFLSNATGVAAGGAALSLAVLRPHFRSPTHHGRYLQALTRF